MYMLLEAGAAAPVAASTGYALFFGGLLVLGGILRYFLNANKV
jgi:hypothetical protein